MNCAYALFAEAAHGLLDAAILLEDEMDMTIHKVETTDRFASKNNTMRAFLQLGRARQDALGCGCVECTDFVEREVKELTRGAVWPKSKRSVNV